MTGRPFADVATDVLRAALDLADTHARQAARFSPDEPGQLPAIVALFRTELQHRGEPMTDPYANGVCPFGEDQAPGSGCIKPAGHDGAHLVTPGDTSDHDDEQLCPAEYPGDDLHVGQLCTRLRDHDGEHTCRAEIAGTDHTRLLAWPAT